MQNGAFIIRRASYSLLDSAASSNTPLIAGTSSWRRQIHRSQHLEHGLNTFILKCCSTKHRHNFISNGSKPKTLFYLHQDRQCHRFQDTSFINYFIRLCCSCHHEFKLVSEAKQPHQSNDQVYPWHFVGHAPLSESFQ